MAFEDFVKTNATIIVWVAHIIVGAYVLGGECKGTLLSWQPGDIIVYIALGASLVVYTMLRKELLLAQNKPPEAKEEKKEEKKTDGSKPFNMEMGDKK